MSRKPEKTYAIYRLDGPIDGPIRWEFWMFVRAVSEKQATANVWWHNKQVPRSSIRAIEGAIPTILEDQNVE